MKTIDIQPYLPPVEIYDDPDYCGDTISQCEGLFFHKNDEPYTKSRLITCGYFNNVGLKRKSTYEWLDKCDQCKEVYKKAISARLAEYFKTCGDDDIAQAALDLAKGDIDTADRIFFAPTDKEIKDIASLVNSRNEPQ